MALLQLFSVVTSIHRLSTIRHLVILQKVSIVYTSMPFMTFIHIPIRTRSCSRFTIRMNSKHSVQLWTVIPFLRIPKMSISETEDIVLITIWLMSSAKGSFFFFVQKTSTRKDSLESLPFQRRSASTLRLMSPL